MPAFIPTLQKTFKFTVVDNLPQAAVTKVGETQVIKCCPLCGCTHQVLAKVDSRPYKPLCQVMPNMFKTQKETWRKLFPDVARYSELRLIVSK